MVYKNDIIYLIYSSPPLCKVDITPSRYCEDWVAKGLQPEGKYQRSSFWKTAEIQSKSLRTDTRERMGAKTLGQEDRDSRNQS